MISNQVPILHKLAYQLGIYSRKTKNKVHLYFGNKYSHRKSPLVIWILFHIESQLIKILLWADPTYLILNEIFKTPFFLSTLTGRFQRKQKNKETPKFVEKWLLLPIREHSYTSTCIWGQQHDWIFYFISRKELEGELNSRQSTRENSLQVQVFQFVSWHSRGNGPHLDYDFQVRTCCFWQPFELLLANLFE